MQDVGFDNGNILINSHTNRIFNFYFPAQSAANKNDGFVPYGTEIVDVNVTIYDADGTNVTAYFLIGTPSIANNIVSVRLKYSSTPAIDRYSIEFDLTFSNGQTDGNTCYNLFKLE